MDKHRIRGNLCLACGEPLDLAVAAAIRAAQSVPKPGDITICFYCGHAMAYAADMIVRELNDRELRFLLAHPKLTQQVKVVRGQVRKRIRKRQ
jgi:hypothetical protein